MCAVDVFLTNLNRCRIVPDTRVMVKLLMLSFRLNSLPFFYV